MISGEIEVSSLEFVQLIKRQSCHYIETSQLISFANQLTGFYMTATLTFNELKFEAKGFIAFNSLNIRNERLKRALINFNCCIRPIFPNFKFLYPLKTGNGVFNISRRYRKITLGKNRWSWCFHYGLSNLFCFTSWIHLIPMHPFFTPWKHLKTVRFSGGRERVHWDQIVN